MTPRHESMQQTQSAVLGNTVEAWLIALAVTVLALLALRVVRRIAAARSTAAIAVLPFRLLGATSWYAGIAVALWLGSRALVLPATAARLVHVLFVVAIALQAARWAIVAVDYGIEALLRRRREQQGADDPELASAAPAARFLGRLAVIAVVVLLALQNLGVDVTAMVTGLGIGGIAIALAVQNILGDLFASLSILLDRPFVVGDFIVIDDKLGTVEKIGLKTTHLRSLSGEQLIVANSDLLGTRIRNFKRMRERRVAFTLGINYQTPLAKLEQLPGVIRACIEAQQRTRFERAHFKQFASSSLEFEAVYWVLDPDFGVHMDVQQAVNLEIFRRFAEQGVEFAFPTQTVILSGTARAS